MGGPGEAAIRRPTVADEHAVEVWPQQVGRFLVASSGLNGVDGRLLRRARPEPLQVAADLPGFIRGDDGTVAKMAPQFAIGQFCPGGGPMHGADEAARTDADAVVLPQQGRDLGERQNPICLLRMIADATNAGPSCTEAAPRASEVCNGCRPRARWPQS